MMPTGATATATATATAATATAQGRNMLGRLLMRERPELRAPPQETTGAITGQ